MPLLSPAPLRIPEGAREVLTTLDTTPATTFAEATRLTAERGIEGAIITPAVHALLLSRGVVDTTIEGRTPVGEHIITHQVTERGRELLDGAIPTRREQVRGLLGSVAAFFGNR